MSTVLDEVVVHCANSQQGGDGWLLDVHLLLADPV